MGAAATGRQRLSTLVEVTPRTAESTVGSTVAEAGTRAPITPRAQEQAVTPRDYEELARRAPGQFRATT